MLDTVIIVPPEQPGNYEDMPEGLDGYWWETESVVCIPFVAAREHGQFMPFLESLEAKGKLLFFPTVINARLDAKLRARGYRDAVAHDDEMGTVFGLAKQCKEVQRREMVSQPG